MIGKYQRRFPGFYGKIISMYARGMSTREIAEHLREFHGIEASAELISTVMHSVIEEVTVWQNRPLEVSYARPHITVGLFGDFSWLASGMAEREG